MTLKALSVAGFDGSGGAGITSDVKIFSKLKLFGLSAITVMTAQNPDKIYKAEPVSNDFLTAQLKSAFGYFSVDVVKIGLVFNEDQSSILAGFLKKYKPKTVVLDPVYISTSGKLLTAQSGSGYPGSLLPLFKYATAVTPNIKEAELISGIMINGQNKMKIAAKIIRERIPGIKNIIIKGSHIFEKSDGGVIKNVVLDSKNKFFVHESKILKTGKQIHGTGCAFSACIASYLGLGMPIESAVLESEKFVSGIIRGTKKIPDNSPDKNIYIVGNI